MGFWPTATSHHPFVSDFFDAPVRSPHQNSTNSQRRPSDTRRFKWSMRQPYTGATTTTTTTKGTSNIFCKGDDLKIIYLGWSWDIFDPYPGYSGLCVRAISTCKIQILCDVMHNWTKQIFRSRSLFLTSKRDLTTPPLASSTSRSDPKKRLGCFPALGRRLILRNVESVWGRLCVE